MDNRIKKRLADLSERCGSNILFDEPLWRYSSVGIGGNAAILYLPGSSEELKEARKCIGETGVPTVVLGKGSNVLVGDGGVDGVVIKLSKGCFETVNVKNETVTAGAGVHLGKLITRCAEEGLSGLEGLIGIPATVGGALKNNASYRSAISECLVKLSVMDAAGNIRWIEQNELEFGYRSLFLDPVDIILEAVFSFDRSSKEDLVDKIKAHFKAKRKKQPLEKKTLGCVFKNPQYGDMSAGRMIEASGMKGEVLGGTKVSEKHANFIVNIGNATALDYMSLMEVVKNAVKNEFSVELDPEIEIFGN
ncbi:MAG: UDP-N-acetylmuramate dehydrogenase [Candidatus Omnitrophica bacterium]|nr:UDP-N-acetylmuramate dehydrogenase [Candidatus Omnitrophota bacterium]